jgi:hypothetical protein
MSCKRTQEERSFIRGFALESDSNVKRDINSVLTAIEGWIEKIEQPLTPLIKGELPT